MTKVKRMSRTIISLGLILFLSSGVVCAALTPVFASVGVADGCAAGEDQPDGKALLCGFRDSFALQDGRALGQSDRHPTGGLNPTVRLLPQIVGSYLFRDALPVSSIHKVSLHILHAVFTL